jgi:hypothetical protein
MIVLIFVFMIIIVMLGGFTAMNSKAANKPPVPNLELLPNKPKAATLASSELNTPGTNELEEELEVEEEEVEEEEEQKVVRGKMNNLIFNLEDVDDDHVEELIVSSEFFEFFKEKTKQ